MHVHVHVHPKNQIPGFFVPIGRSSVQQRNCVLTKQILLENTFRDVNVNLSNVRTFASVIYEKHMVAID